MKKFKTKLIVIYSLLVTAIIVSLLIMVNNYTKRAIVSFLEQELKIGAEYVNSYIKSFHRPINSSLFKSEEIADALKRIAQKSQMRITIVAEDGIVLYDSELNRETMENHSYRPEIMEAKKSGLATSIRFSNTLQTEMLYVAAFFGTHYIRTAKPLIVVHQLISEITRNVVISGLVVFVVSIIINLLLASAFTRPIDESVSFINKFFNGDMNARILNYKDDELGYLQASINRLADSIQKKINDLTIEKDVLKMIIESIRDPLALFDRFGNISVHNGAFMQMVGADREIVGKSYFSVIRNSELNSKIHYAFTSRKEVIFEEAIKGKNYYVLILPFRGKQDESILLVMQDVTEQKRMQQLKSELVGNLSHELKTPISIVRGYLETIREVLNDRGAIEQFIEKAIANLERQNAIINDMLKLNKLETTVHAKDEYINIRSIIQQCVELLNLKIQKKSVSVSLDLDACDGVILGNSFLAEEIFFNLIDNAVSYNIQGGSINISARRMSNAIHIAIADTGIGIPESEIDRIFERFYRVDKSRSRETGGTGLGLAIVKHAALILGWEIDVKSSPSGSVFTVIVNE
ncbi:MAG: ATP-binding protein [Spirochaetes bacterium]|nr:ATP-binding protein [Spirochaetota bacterium]